MSEPIAGGKPAAGPGPVGSRLFLVPPPLTLTLAHRAKREGWIGEIAGFYAQCPFISNAWAAGSEDLPSLTENDGYFISTEQLAILASLYDPDGTHADDATCWASAATDGDLEGLPPHVISVNELDPLRDEGLRYYRRLTRAGVPAVGRMVAGTCHGGDLLLAASMPEVFAWSWEPERASSPPGTRSRFARSRTSSAST